MLLLSFVSINLTRKIVAVNKKNQEKLKSLLPVEETITNITVNKDMRSSTPRRTRFLFLYGFVKIKASPLQFIRY
jgi:hypothetical protein